MKKLSELLKPYQMALELIRDIAISIALIGSVYLFLFLAYWLNISGWMQ